MAEEPEGVVDQSSMQIGDDLYVEWVSVASLREQDVNAQQMQPRHFDRLTENIRMRGMIESLPYCHQPLGDGPVSIVSGHHRARAARAAGLDKIPVIVDKQPMTKSTVIAKQIAHNELHGMPDEQILRQLVSAMETVDDMLMSGLDESLLPTVGPDDTQLFIPHAEFDWRVVTLLFLPKQMREFEDVIDALSSTDMLGVVDADVFKAFSNAILDYSRLRNIKSMGAAVYTLAKVAQGEVEKAEQEEAEGWIPLHVLFKSGSVPADAGQVILSALDKYAEREGAEDKNLWQALELWAADYLASE